MLIFESYVVLCDWFWNVVYSDNIYVVVFLFNGGNFFFGGDVYDIIGLFIRMLMKELFVFIWMMGDLVKVIVNCGKFVIVVIDGVCVGVGVIIVMVLDLCFVILDVKMVFLFMCVGFVGCDMGVCVIFFWIIG